MNFNERLNKLVNEARAAGLDLDELQEEVARHFIAGTLTECNGNRSRAAKRMGINRNTLARRMASLAMESPKPRAPQQSRRSRAADRERLRALRAASIGRKPVQSSGLEVNVLLRGAI